ncbi:MAG: YkgJ family cysteine cluster protein [endosymbiont of Galathealinum brachiosum]|uniref:YkgJ family cysteine cluster protein n=1 Tax=endosymbiont of Galathealinum brachiosum TaxID=2200906 RepID=A0A370D938_9GAMM|nr:MAG: YkgJ family cysteine cluster protein [endosymbiont of Galathealinum brachiosum]
MSEITESDYRKPKRLTFTDDEKRLPWLTTLLDAFSIIDKGVSAAIEREHKQGRELACAKGCSSCCTTHQDIPVYPLELMGMSWYVIEKLQSPLREQLKAQLSNIDNIHTCPFLLEGSCSIHPMRPAACRQFNVLDKPCSDGEDAYHTRKQDVMIPIQHYIDNAFDTMLPFYGIKKKGERKKAIKQGTLHSIAKAMRECNWQTLPEKMDKFDK